MKFIRDYKILIQTPEGDTLTITKPFSVKFDITRNTLSSSNTCGLTIWNLKKSTRNRIFKDRYVISDYWQLVIMAGYEKLETVFQGNIYQSMSYKNGPDWVTQIEAFDGQFAIQNGITSETITAGTSKRDVFQRVINNMDNVVSGFFGERADGETGSRGFSLMGQSSSILGELTDGNYFIDNETVNILNPDEVISGQVLLQPRVQHPQQTLDWNKQVRLQISRRAF